MHPSAGFVVLLRVDLELSKGLSASPGSELLTETRQARPNQRSTTLNLSPSVDLSPGISMSMTSSQSVSLCQNISSRVSEAIIAIPSPTTRP